MKPYFIKMLFSIYLFVLFFSANDTETMTIFATSGIVLLVIGFSDWVGDKRGKSQNDAV